MKKTKVGSAEQEALETMNVMTEMLDQATHCAGQTSHRAAKAIGKSSGKATERIEKAVTSAARRIREKVGK